MLFDRFSRGRYATDASVYQVMPLGVVLPKSGADVEAVLGIAREHGVPVLPRGGGTSQCGQTVNRALVLDCTAHLDGLLEFDAGAATAVVEPGLVLDELNRHLRAHGLWFPVDVSTASRATLGGMTANNSCGSRSIRYGTMRDNVLAIDALLADGTRARFEAVDRERLLHDAHDTPTTALVRDLLALGEREADEIRARFPDLLRRVGGYNIDALVPGNRPNNLAHLLVGSEGTLAFSERITLKLSPLPGNRVLGVCHFPTFHAAMDAAQHLVRLDPSAVELVDHTMIGLSRDIAMFRPVVERFVRGDPAALLLVEFAEPEAAENLRRLRALHETMAELGFRFDDPGKQPGGVVDAVDADFQKAIWEVRKSGLNIMMSMKSEGKPVSFVEDCAVRLPDLAEYTERLTRIFEKHGTTGTWYAHASVGTLHVRPVLNLKLEADVRAMRAIAEECFEMVREYRGSHSGEHGDGIVRSEFHRDMFGDRLVADFEWVKQRFDPHGLFNPNRIVHPPRMDDRSLLRYAPDYRFEERATVFDWSAWPGASGGLQGAVEMCNNNGACRKFDDSVMCPSWRVTRREKDLVRGRANSLRLALSGQLGPDAFESDEMADTLSLCVSCKACRRECPTGVDMAKFKIEVLAARANKRGVGLRERLVATLPRYAPWAAKAPWLANLRNRVPLLARAAETLLGLAAERTLPAWRGDWFGSRAADTPAVAATDADVLLFADTFNRWFEPHNLRAAREVLTRAGLRVALAGAGTGERPLCCGRTYLAAGLAEQARAEMRRTAKVLRGAVETGTPVVGLEPSCLLTFRDEAPAMLGADWNEAWGRRVMLLEEFIAERAAAGTFNLPLSLPAGSRALLHGHCHQKSFGVMSPVLRTLALVDGLSVETVASSCCGMAGAFGFQAETLAVSKAMGEASLLPAVRSAPAETWILADGTSCRHQVGDGTGREAVHVAELLRHAAGDSR